MLLRKLHEITAETGWARINSDVGGPGQVQRLTGAEWEQEDEKMTVVIL